MAMSKAKRLERLRNAVTVMERVQAQPEHKFDLGSWADPAFNAKKDEYHEISTTETKAIECGMSACFGGWLALDSVARSQGLHMDKINEGPSFKDLYDAEAIASFLGIEQDEADHIVFPGNYPCEASSIKPADVICRLNKLIEKYDGQSDKTK